MNELDPREPAELRDRPEYSGDVVNLIFIEEFVKGLILADKDLPTQGISALRVRVILRPTTRITVRCSGKPHVEASQRLSLALNAVA